MTFLKEYGDTEGPLGFPMKEAEAKALDAILQANPDAEHVRLVVPKATTEFSEGERADVAWIQTEAIDHDHEIVLASGFRDDAFKGNPIVTLNHQYELPPVGRSIWRKRIKDGARRGVKAKTIYPQKPEDWTDAWAPDSAWGLVRASLMVGKSIGFLTLKSRGPTDEEIKRKPELRRPPDRGGVDPARIRVLLAADEPGNPGGGGQQKRRGAGDAAVRRGRDAGQAAGPADSGHSDYAALRDREGGRAGDTGHRRDGDGVKAS